MQESRVSRRFHSEAWHESVNVLKGPSAQSDYRNMQSVNSWKQQWEDDSFFDTLLLLPQNGCW